MNWSGEVDVQECDPVRKERQNEQHDCLHIMLTGRTHFEFQAIGKVTLSYTVGIWVRA